MIPASRERPKRSTRIRRRGRGPEQGLPPHARGTGGARAGRGRSRHSARRAVRPAGPQRRRQIDPDQHPGRAGASRPRARRGSGASTSTASRAAARAAIGVVPQELNHRPVLHAARAAGAAGRALRRAAAPSGAPRRSSRRSASPTRPTPMRARSRAACGGGCWWPRRWCIRRRCWCWTSRPPASTSSCASSSGLCARAERRRHDGAADHALSRGGRGAVRPHRHHQPRPGHRLRRHAGAAAAARPQGAGVHLERATSSPCRRRWRASTPR